MRVSDFARRGAAPGLPLLLLLVLAGCGDHSILPPEADVGPAPRIVPPVNRTIPTVNIAPAIGWPAGETPTPAAGLAVTAFATGLDHPRNVLVLPNGDVLVAETAPVSSASSCAASWPAPVPAAPAPTASRFCATPMATASPSIAAPSSAG